MAAAVTNTGISIGINHFFASIFILCLKTVYCVVLILADLFNCAWPEL